MQRRVTGRRQDLVGRGGRGAELADHDARGGVGEGRGLGQSRAGAQGQRQRRDHRVAGAGHVEDLARGRGDVHRPPAALEQAHALLAARDERRVAADDLEDALADAAQVGIGADPNPRCLLGLVLVGRHDARRGRTRGGAPSGPRARAASRRRAAASSAFITPPRHDALLVVRHHDGVDTSRITAPDASQQRHFERRAGSRRPASRSARQTCWWCAMMRVFSVVGRPPLASTSASSTPAARSSSRSRGPGGIVAHDPGQDRGAVAASARCAPRCRRRPTWKLSRCDLHHGHRRLGRDAPHASPQELVEHHVAEDQDALPRMARSSARARLWVSVGMRCDSTAGVATGPTASSRAPSGSRAGRR